MDIVRRETKQGNIIFGRAGDGDEVGTSAEELYQWILERQDKMLEFGVTTIENVEFTKTWIHLDSRNYGFNIKELQIFTP